MGCMGSDKSVNTSSSFEQFGSGIDTDTSTAVAKSSIVTSNVMSAPSSGKGTYTAAYKFHLLDSVVQNGSTISGTRNTYSGNITLNAEFDANDIFAKGIDGPENQCSNLMNTCAEQ